MTTWDSWQQRRLAALDACRTHRRTYHLSTDDVAQTDCQRACLAWTTCPLQRRHARVIDRFFGDYIFLSTFYYVDLVLEDRAYPTLEHAFQAYKTHSLRWRERIRRAPTPKAAKRLGYRVPLREDWDTVRIDVMHALARQKFDPDAHPDLAAKLLATRGALLVEGNTWGDRFWGVDRATGLGLNHLGRILMEVRAELPD
jgi:hypothetical protein